MRYFKLCIWLAGILFLHFFVSCESAQTQQGPTGRVVKIVDGDTYDILLQGEQVRVRMEGIDAPERGMDYYKVAKTYLGDLCMGQQIRLEIKEKDQYGRLIAKGYLEDGRELCEEMVKAGLAWHFRKYSDDSMLANAEAAARSARIGLWSLPEPVAPWDFRANRRKR